MIPDELGWIDWAMLAVLLLSFGVGALRGLVFELLALAGWVVAYFVALWVAPVLGPYLPVGTPGSMVNYAVAFVSAFLLTMIVWGVLSRLTRSLVRATPLAPIDRVLGAAFGLLRGAIVLVAIAVLVGYTPAAKSQAWQASLGAHWLDSAIQGLKGLLPANMAKVLPA